MYRRNFYAKGKCIGFVQAGAFTVDQSQPIKCGFPMGIPIFLSFFCSFSSGFVDCSHPALEKGIFVGGDGRYYIPDFHGYEINRVYNASVAERPGESR